ncbi:MAG: MATE family efflux transporter, partial [Myxococcota bacterium]
MADDKSDNRAALIEGDVSKALRGLAVPMMVGIVSILAVNLIDTYFVGQLGTAELAAMSFTFPVVGLVFSVAMGLGIGATSTVARALGGGDTRVVKRLTTHAMLLAVLVVAIVSGVGIATQRPVFELLGAEPELIPLLEEYMTIWYAGVILLVVPMVGNGIMRATGDARTPALSMMTAAVINLILDPLFIFGLGPIPGMGLQGAAIATLLSRVVVMFFALYVLTVRLNLLEFRLPPLGELLDSWRKILSVGLPAAITNILAPIAAAVLTAIVASEGSTAVAGYGIGVRLEGFLLIAPMALASSLTPFVGQNWGAMRTERVDQALVISRNFVLLWGAAAWLILLVGGGTVAGIFSDDPAVIGAAQTYLWVVPLSYGAHGLVSVASATFNAVDRALRSTWLSALRSLVLAIPLAYAGGQLFGLTGVFGGIAVA